MCVEALFLHQNIASNLSNMEELDQEGRTNIVLFQSFLVNSLLIIHEEITKENQNHIGGVKRDNYVNFRFDFLKLNLDNVD